MATPINKIGFGDLAPTLNILTKAGGTTDDMDWIRGGADEANARMLLAFVREKRSAEAAQKGAAEEACGIVIINSGYTGKYADERRVGSYSTYPAKWVPKTALHRATILAPHFPGVDFSYVEELASHYYRDVSKNGGRKLVMSEYADGGLLVVPKLGAAAKCLKKAKKGWHASNVALEYILGVFKELFPSFENYLEGKNGPEYMRLLELTAKMLMKLDAETPGDVLVLPYQAGALFAGYSMRSSRLHMEALKLHIPADAFTNICRAISDPESFESGSLFADCPGTEMADAAGDFRCAPYLYCFRSGFGFRTYGVYDRFRHSGSTSLVLPASVPSE